MPFTPQQAHRRAEFIASIGAAIAAGTVQDKTIANADLHMTAEFLRDWNVTDWTDLPTDSQAEIDALVQQLRDNIAAFTHQQGDRRKNNSALCLLWYGKIAELLQPTL